ncbi:MAG: argininosuccinate lyase, partial [Gammaproteobacteria bacterium]|nr:argininosuccinate lyase [Gammaproteobacteria bacterium]
LEELQEFSPVIEAGVFEILTLEGSVAARQHHGATSPVQVRKALARGRSRL